MLDNNANPAPTPAGDQPAGNQQASSQEDAPVGNQAPPATDQSQPPGGDTPSGQPAPISVEDLNDLKRKAGRWDARVKSDRQNRRQSRRADSKDDYDADKADPALLDSLRDRDDKINELSSANVRLEVKDKVRDLIDGEEYKDLPVGIKRAVGRNPLGFANANSQSIQDVVADIQDYLDDELDRTASNPAPQAAGQNQSGEQAPANQNDSQAGNPPKSQAPAQQTPPAGGSGPSKPDTAPFAGTEGMTGSKRSTTILQNILKAK